MKKQNAVTSATPKVTLNASLVYFTPNGKEEQVPMLLVERPGRRPAMVGASKVRAIVEVLDNLADARAVLQSVMSAPVLTLNGEVITPAGKPAGKAAKPSRIKTAAEARAVTPAAPVAAVAPAPGNVVKLSVDDERALARAAAIAKRFGL